MKKIFCYFVLISLIGNGFAQRWTNYNAANSDIAGNEVKAIFIDENGIKWFGTTNGLSRFDGISWQSYNTDNNLTDKAVSDLMLDETMDNPSLWVATDNGMILYELDGSDVTDFVTYTKDNSELISSNTTSATIGQSSIAWFGTEEGVSAIQGETWQNPIDYGFTDKTPILSAGSASDGWNYFGTNGIGVIRYKWDVDAVTGSSAYDIDWSGLLSNNIYAVYVDSKDVQWYGTEMGVAKHVGNETKDGWTNYLEADGLAHNTVYSIAEDAQGNMWFGTQKGVSYFDGSEWTNYTTADGLIDNTIYDIAIDNDGSIWFGTSNGVSRLDPNVSGIQTKAQIGYYDITVYPNPVKNSMQIAYKIPANGFVDIQIHDINGKAIMQIEQAYKTAGKYTIEWQRNKAMDAGIYLLRITSGLYSQVKKIIIVD